MPLTNIRVIELAGLAPAPFCGMLLADFGATVIRVDKVSNSANYDCLRNGKLSLALDLKKPKGGQILKKLIKQSDVLIEPFRKGVMEKLGLGPQELMSINPKLIYARLTGFGQTGSHSNKAGHDINFLALSGLLSLLGRKHENPIPPANLIGDFGGGGLMCAFGILLALFERCKSGKGQVIDCAMVDGTAYLGSWILRNDFGLWKNERGSNLLDTGAHFYEVYKTKDNKYIALGSIESKFYEQLINILNVSGLETQYSDFEEKKKIISEIILTKTRDEWCSIFEDFDVCFTPVLELNEVAEYPHNKERGNFIRSSTGLAIPKPAPLLSRTPGKTNATKQQTENGSDTRVILLQLGYTEDEIKELHEEKVVTVVSTMSKL